MPRSHSTHGRFLYPYTSEGGVRLVKFAKSFPGESLTMTVTNIKRRAFTLVELLVVIGIIGTLVGLLLPALSSARAAANASASANNMSGFGRGFELYATNNDGLYTSGAFDHNRDGDVREHGWVADLIDLKVANPGKALDLASRNKINEKVGDYMGATNKSKDLAQHITDGVGKWVTGDTVDTTSGVAYFGGAGADAATKARDVWNTGFNSNYATTWHFSRGDPSATDGYASGSKNPASGDGGLTQNHLNQGLTTAARVAMMGPARAGDGSDALVVSGSARASSGAAAGIMTAFAGKPIVKVNDLLVEAFNDGMNVTFGTALGGVTGQKVHEFNDIEPLHQPKNTAGTGGFAPILFADGHVEKVYDTVQNDNAAVKGDGYIGNGVTKDTTGKITAVLIDAPGYQEISEQIWIKRLRNRQSASGSVNEG
jgi:prepilin-type N-terminal cleavage/methylation domain-containing protein/prepilin-type processing-associated H-X9-DG protein